MNVEKLCRKAISKETAMLLLQMGAQTFCIYCNYVFDKVPVLPATCPRCKMKLEEFCFPVFEIIRRSE